MARQSWIDEKTNEPLIDDYAAKLTTFLDAMADGVIDDKELSDQETRLVTLLKEVEPTLDDEQHAKMTALMCELSAYNIMQFCHQMQQHRPAATSTWRP
jgi:hypothetical protein